MSGYVKLYRKVRENWVWSNPDYFRAWTDMIMEAEWKPVQRLIADKLILVPRGGLAASERYLSDRWKWSTGKVRRFLAKLAESEMVKRETKQGITVVTLLNYERYAERRSSNDSSDEPEVVAPAVAPAVANQRREEGKKEEEKETRASAGELMSSEIPPVTINTATDWGETVMIPPDIVSAWWFARDAVGWRRKDQLIANWQSDLKGFHASWQRNDANRSNAKAGLTLSKGGDSASTRQAILRGEREPSSTRNQRAWIPRVGDSQKGLAWSQLKQVTRDRIVNDMEEEGINITA